MSLLLLVAQPLQAEEFRKSNLAKLSALGFKASPSLPNFEERGLGGLRPQGEIEARFAALHALVIWVAAPAGTVDDKGMQKRALTGALSVWVTEEEKEIFRLSKAEANEKYLDSIGWQMENMWALGWVLGYHTQPELRGQLQGELARDLVFKFGLSDERSLRSFEEVRDLEDLFYCTHNAVRGAWLGGKTVPEGYDSFTDGREISERRHALTWCLSPGVSWDKTDLST